MDYRPRRVQGTVGGGDEVTEDLAPVLEQLRGILGVLPAYVPDPGDGADWLQFDSALSDLHRALLALDEVEHTRRGRRRAALRSRAPRGLDPAAGRMAVAGPRAAGQVATGAGTSR